MDKVVLGQRIAEARGDVGMTQEGLGHHAGLDRTAISRLEKGDRKLSVTELVDIAHALGKPLAYFVTDPVPAVISRRTDGAHAHASTRALEIDLSQFSADVCTLLAMDLLKPVERDPRARVPRSHSEAENAATAIRRQLGADNGPIDDLGRASERLGLYAFGAPLGDGGPDGACVEVNGEPTTLGAAVVNSSAPSGRRRMTLAHELGHWLFGDAYDSEASTKSEQMINSFAIHFLAPRAGVRQVWNAHAERSDRDKALIVAAVFRLSWSAAIGQLSNIGVISQEARRGLSEDEPRAGDYLHLGLSWPDELGTGYLSPGFVAAALEGYASGRLTQARTTELLRGALGAEDLPAMRPPSLDDLRDSFAGHDV